MPTLTIRNVPDQVVKSLKALARSRRHSMEQELRELLEAHLAERRSVLAQIEAGWAQQTRRPTVKEGEAWMGFGRRRAPSSIRTSSRIASSAQSRSLKKPGSLCLCWRKPGLLRSG